MASKKADKKCPKCGNVDENEIDESFSHDNNVFYYEYHCRQCNVFWRRRFEYVGLEVRKDEAWKA